MMTRPLGELNGIWSLAFRVMCAVFPMLVALQVWLVSNTFEFKHFMNQGDRFTAKDALTLELKLTGEMNQIRQELTDSIRVNRDERNTQMQKLDDKITQKLELLQQSINQLTLLLEKHLARP